MVVRMAATPLVEYVLARKLRIEMRGTRAAFARHIEVDTASLATEATVPAGCPLYQRATFRRFHQVIANIPLRGVVRRVFGRPGESAPSCGRRILADRLRYAIAANTTPETKASGNALVPRTPCPRFGPHTTETVVSAG